MRTYLTIGRVLGCAISITMASPFIGLSSHVHAQDLAQNVNGIFYPRSSEEFFQEGRERLDEEIRLVQEMNAAVAPELVPELMIDESGTPQSEDLEQEADELLVAPPDLSNEQEQIYYLQ